MKFTHGFWMPRHGVQGHFPARVHEYEQRENTLVLHTATNPSTERGATLSCPMLSVELSSPRADVIRVRVTHHAGGMQRGPAFHIADRGARVEIAERETHFEVRTGSLTAQVSKDPWRLDFLGDGQLLTRSGHRNLAWMTDGDGTSPSGNWIDTEATKPSYLREELALGVGECIYGLGERFTPFVRNGQVVETWNEDGGTASDLAYKNIPFYLSNAGYGVFVNHPERVSFEIGSEKVSRVGFCVEGQTLEYFLIYGPTPKEVLEKYTDLTGRPALPPPWSFGLWLTTSFTTDYSEEIVSRMIQGMIERDLPLHVFHFDCFWMKAFHWCDFEWDKDSFPDPVNMLRRLKEFQIRISVWLNPYIAQRSALFEEGKRLGYFVKRPDGSVWQWDGWQAGMALVDFTNPDAYQWFGDKLRTLIDMGVDCFKTDFGERIPTDVVYFDGSDPKKMHNYYAFLYNKCVFEVLEEKKGKGEAIVFARAATAGGQLFPVHWGGDCEASYESMAESLRGGLSLGLSGFGFWSHDIGGFESTSSPEVYKRWIAFGLLSSHSRLHGSASYRVPWRYDDEAVDVLRYYTKLKCQLMPYLYAAAIEAHEKGIPMLRAMLLEYPDDPGCAYLDRQYMLGPSLLVAPVFHENGQVDFYVPAGKWTRFETGEVIVGPRWVRETQGLATLPVLVRPNALLTLGQIDSRPDYDYTDNFTAHLVELQEGFEAEAEIPGVEGAMSVTVSALRKGNTLRVRADRATKPWAVLLRNITEVASAKGGTCAPHRLGTLVTAESGATELIIQLGRARETAAPTLAKTANV